MALFYKLRKDPIIDEEGFIRTVYGAEAVRLIDSHLDTLVSVPDIFSDREKAEDFVCICNALHLPPSRLIDLVEIILDAEPFPEE